MIIDFHAHLYNRDWLPGNAPPGIRFSPEEIDNILYKNALRVTKMKDTKELKP